MHKQARLEQTVIVPWRRLVARSRTQQVAARVTSQQRAAPEGVDDQVLRIRQAAPCRASEEKTSREIDPFDIEARAPRHLQVDQRQRDRNASSPFEHLIQKAVA